MKIDTRQIAPSTIVRTLVLLTGLINLALTMWGKNPLPFKDQDIAEFVAYLWAGASAIWAWWKNNSFTEAAIHADKYKASVNASAIFSEHIAGVTEPIRYTSAFIPEEEEDDDEYDEDEDPEEDEDLPEEDYDEAEDSDEPEE